MNKTGIYLIPLLLSIFFFACKERDTLNNLPVLAGGKGGEYSLAIFTKTNGKGVASKVFLKYGGRAFPGDTASFDEKGNTITEPGFGPHVHFNSLTKGVYYFFYESVGKLKGDTTIVIRSSSSKSRDILVNLN